jgi:stage II sporulation protein D
MSIRKKLILIGICIGIILVIFTVNVVRKIKDDSKEDLLQDTETENVITRAEAYRLLSYLEYDRAEREALPLGITYTDTQMSGWYDTYVNAAWKMGLIEDKVTITPGEALTYAACKDLIDRLILAKPNFQTVYDGLSFDFLKAEENIRLPEFLELYEALLSVIPEAEKLLKEETPFVLGREVTEDGKDRMVTDLGKYYYLDAQSYVKYFTEKAADANITEGASAGASPVPSPASGGAGVGEEDTDGSDAAVTQAADEAGAGTPELTGAAEATGANAYSGQENLIDQYVDKGIKVLVCGQEIIYITGITTDKITIHNVWIKRGEGTLVDTFVNGIDKSFQAKFKLSGSIEKVVGDITVENRKVVQISAKPDMIHGKVLRSGKDFIEIEGYGEVPLEEDYKIYKIYGTLSMEPTSSILVGYENTDFIVSNGRISAAIITESIKAENIRVLIKTSGFKSYFHDKVEFTATDDFIVSSDETQNAYKAGDVVTVMPEDAMLEGQRITIKTISEDAKIQILSIEHSYGNPKYRGSMEIARGEDGLLIVNELPLEEYLYSVIPSEMPTSYGAEALKVQAVCARSYAYKHLMANSLSEYGAHVDDSVTFQVYNNIAENEDSILAVKDTYGEVIEYGGNVINAFYFSTSCGHTTEASSVWAGDSDLPYIEGKLILVEEDAQETGAQSEAAGQYEDLSSEENFRNFIQSTEIKTYDSTFNWYRWTVTMDTENIKKVMDSSLAARYKANPELVLTMTKEAGDGEEAVFESLPVDTVGDIVDISVLKRESSGIITEMLVTGTQKTIKVLKEYNIRTFLAPAYDTIIRLDKSEVESLSLLPSAFFTIDKVTEDGRLTGIALTGGGYGHGVGMSQNGVKALADSGKGYEEIVAYFYVGIEMGFIYE